MRYITLELPVSREDKPFRHGSEVRRWLSKVAPTLPPIVWNRGPDGKTITAVASVRCTCNPRRPTPEITLIGSAQSYAETIFKILVEALPGKTVKVRSGIFSISELDSETLDHSYLPYVVDTVAIDRPGSGACNPQRQPQYSEEQAIELVKDAIRKGLTSQCNLIGEPTFDPNNLRFGRIAIRTFRPILVGMDKTAHAMTCSASVEINHAISGPWHVGRNVSYGCGALYRTQTFMPPKRLEERETAK